MAAMTVPAQRLFLLQQIGTPCGLFSFSLSFMASDNALKQQAKGSLVRHGAGCMTKDFCNQPNTFQTASFMRVSERR
ncbi:MAG: hypothetical protein ACREVK_04495 [Gammaproteobacteria bacterium]